MKKGRKSVRVAGSVVEDLWLTRDGVKDTR